MDFKHLVGGVSGGITSWECIYRCLVDNCLEFFQVSACVNLILVGNIVNLDEEGSRQVQTVPQ